MKRKRKKREKGISHKTRKFQREKLEIRCKSPSNGWLLQVCRNSSLGLLRGVVVAAEFFLLARSPVQFCSQLLLQQSRNGVSSFARDFSNSSSRGAPIVRSFSVNFQLNVVIRMSRLGLPPIPARDPIDHYAPLLCNSLRTLYIKKMPFFSLPYTVPAVLWSDCCVSFSRRYKSLCTSGFEGAARSWSRRRRNRVTIEPASIHITREIRAVM